MTSIQPPCPCQGNNPIQNTLRAIRAAEFFINSYRDYLADHGDDLDSETVYNIEDRLEQVEAGRYNLIDTIPEIIKAVFPKQFKEIVSASAEAK